MPKNKNVLKYDYTKLFTENIYLRYWCINNSFITMFSIKASANLVTKHKLNSQKILWSRQSSTNFVTLPKFTMMRKKTLWIYRKISTILLPKLQHQWWQTKSFYILAVPTCIPPNGHLDKTCSQGGSEIFKTFWGKDLCCLDICKNLTLKPITLKVDYMSKHFENSILRILFLQHLQIGALDLLTLYAPSYRATSSPIRKTLSSLSISSSMAILRASLTVT